MRRLEEIFGRGSRQEIENVTTKEKIVERIEELPKKGKNSLRFGRR